MQPHQYHVYILRCADASYYVGITNTLDRRIAEHQAGLNPTAYTFRRRPVTLAYYAFFPEVTQAIAFEKQVKGWSRAKKEALIRGDFLSLPNLAKCRNETSHELFKAPDNAPTDGTTDENPSVT